MNDDAARVRLELESRPESVTLVRAALSALGEVLALDQESLDDLNTAVSEACNNVVLHAYDDETTGPLIVSLTAAPEMLEVLVEDHGSGIRQLDSSDSRMRVGLAVISALADRAEFSSRAAGGTVVRMQFGLDRSEPFVIPATPSDGDPDHAPVELDGDAVVWLKPSALLAPVLGRMCRARAAWTHFSVDRFQDLYAIGAAIGAYAEAAAAGPLIGFAITATSRRLELTGGPFLRSADADPGLAMAVSRMDAIAELVDGVALVPAGAFEQLNVVIADTRGGLDTTSSAQAAF